MSLELMLKLLNSDLNVMYCKFSDPSEQKIVHNLIEQKCKVNKQTQAPA